MTSPRYQPTTRNALQITTATLRATGKLCWLVASQSEENKYHIVSRKDTDSYAFQCDCKGYEMRGCCAHTKVVVSEIGKALQEIGATHLPSLAKKVEPQDAAPQPAYNVVKEAEQVAAEASTPRCQICGRECEQGQDTCNHCYVTREDAEPLPARKDHDVSGSPLGADCYNGHHEDCLRPGCPCECHKAAAIQTEETMQDRKAYEERLEAEHFDLQCEYAPDMDEEDEHACFYNALSDTPCEGTFEEFHTLFIKNYQHEIAHAWGEESQEDYEESIAPVTAGDVEDAFSPERESGLEWDAGSDHKAQNCTRMAGHVNNDKAFSIFASER